MKWWIGGFVAAALLLPGCDRGEPKQADTPGAETATATAEVTAVPSPPPQADGPLRKTYKRGESVDVERGTLFLDPRTGGGEAWADVGASPTGMFVAWNGADGKQPPVLFRTDANEKVELDTGGQPGTVLSYSPGEAEVSVRTASELLIISTQTGAVRLRFALPSAAEYAHAHWGPGGQVAVTMSERDGTSLGIAAWAEGELKAFAEAPDNWVAWSPDGATMLASQAKEREQAFSALIDFASGGVTRLAYELHNPRWSESGRYFEGQLPSGEVIVFRADGTPHMKLNGVCAVFGTPWVGDEISTWGFGEDVLIAMDGSTRHYEPAFLSEPSAELRPDGSVALVERFRGTTVLAELRGGPNVGFTFRLGYESVTPDGRGVLVINGKATGACEHVGLFAVELL